MKLNKNSIIFLGTGTSQGVPVIGCTDPVCLSKNPKDKRLRTSALVNYKGLDLLLDCGTDFRMQMLRESKTNVDAVLLTHEHTDHIGGLDDLRPINFLKKKDIPIYGLPRVLDNIKKRFSYAFDENKYPGAPGFELFPIHNAFEIESIEIYPIHVLHGKLPIIGYRIGELSYITDASFVSNEEIRKIYESKILVINALRHEEHHSHFNLKQALDLIKKVNPTEAYLTHISYELGLHQEVEHMLPSNIFIAYDGLTIDF